MSRVGKHPVQIKDGVTVDFANGIIKVKGKLGELSYTPSDLVKVEVKDGEVVVSPVDDSKSARAMWGTTRANINDMVKGVSEGFKCNMEIVGVGYKAQMQGKNLKLALGFSHDVDFAVPEGIEVKCPTPTTLEISGFDKQKVGQVASEIRGFRPPEPYKGKGVKYQGERILRKEGKKK
jgi:large subunit ribosomal protein L6